MGKMERGHRVLEDIAVRTVVVASANADLRQHLHDTLKHLRWKVFEAGRGAEAMVQIEQERPEAVLIDEWFPDLEAREFTEQIRLMHPQSEVITMDGECGPLSRSSRRHELLHVVRQARRAMETGSTLRNIMPVVVSSPCFHDASSKADISEEMMMLLPEMIGASKPMRELANLVRLVAPRSTTVLIEGETGTGKEVVAKAIHRLSNRAGKPFVVLNCAAIPEALLEAELFGHTRGAFTGAVQSRMGRIEAADGGTLFLDEIGEMPLALQAKMLRFLEYGEIQKIGDNDTTRVDVRVIAATHQPLLQRAEEKTFRLDLYHRLAVFPIGVPALRARMEDLPILSKHFLAKLGEKAPRKYLNDMALEKLQQHHWHGNVRELMHVLERATILAGESMIIEERDIRC